MKTSKGKSTTCSRGHTFLKSNEQPVCPTCWPGRYRSSSPRKNDNFKK